MRFTGWAKNGQGLTRTEYQKMAKRAEKVGMPVPNYLVSLGYIHISKPWLVAYLAQKGGADH